MSKQIVSQEEQEVKTRECCVCHEFFEVDPEVDAAQVLCPGCEELGIRCGCIMPWQSCAICRAVEALGKGEPNPVLDLSWFGYKSEEVYL